MKFCNKCGGKLPEGVRFCPFCGNSIAAPTPAPTPEPVIKPAPTPAPAPAKKKGTGKGIAAVILIIALLAAIGGGIYWAFSEGHLDPVLQKLGLSETQPQDEADEEDPEETEEAEETEQTEQTEDTQATDASPMPEQTVPPTEAPTEAPTQAPTEATEAYQIFQVENMSLQLESDFIESSYEGMHGFYYNDTVIVLVLHEAGETLEELGYAVSHQDYAQAVLDSNSLDSETVDLGSFSYFVYTVNGTSFLAATYVDSNTCWLIQFGALEENFDEARMLDYAQQVAFS